MMVLSGCDVCPKVVGVQQYLVKPTVADINENVLSEQLVEESALTEELVKNAGQPLQSAIRQVPFVVPLFFLSFHETGPRSIVGFI